MNINEIPISILFFILFILFLLSAFFSGSETALMSLNRYKLKHQAEKGHAGARLAQKLLARTDRLISLILIGNNFVNILITQLATLLGFTLGAMIGGAVVTETVFAWPGLGRLLVVSVAERDLAVVQLIVLLAAVTMAVTNMIVDLLYGVLDPRIGTRRRQGH